MGEITPLETDLPARIKRKVADLSALVEMAERQGYVIKLEQDRIVYSSDGPAKRAVSCKIVRRV